MNNTTTYYGITVDPLHIGAGGYRLGRVDNTIIREPGTGLPKLPGSSISGVCRNYAIYGLDDQEQKKARECATDSNDKKKNNCGKCAICQTFGFANGETQTNQIGRVKFFDGSIVAFPVSTMAGPVWVTTASILKNLDSSIPVKEPEKDKVLLNFDLPGSGSRINLGWLYMPYSKEPSLKLPSEAVTNGYGTEISSRLVCVPQWLFPELVNSNLEVRTSVSIDFETGAADSGKLFTYEAIPRATLVSFDVVVDTLRCNDEWMEEEVKKIVDRGLKLFESMGLGGMNTRGFGRMKILNL